MPRFVILEHDFPELHWDLMLETGDVLRTWRLKAPPRPGETTVATALFNHRLVYLDYEGPISGNRGSVRRWDRGTYAVEVEEENLLVVRLEGKRLQGLLRLFPEQGDSWRSQFEGKLVSE